MSFSKRFMSTASATALMLASFAPMANAADTSEVFQGSANAEPLAADEMAATEGRIAFTTAATGALVFAAGASLGYTIGSDLAG
jgi:hypothetical protein